MDDFSNGVGFTKPLCGFQFERSVEASSDLQKENDDLKMRLFGARLEIRKLRIELTDLKIASGNFNSSEASKVKNSLKQQQDNIQNGDNQRQHTPTVYYEPDDNSAGGGGG